MGGSQLLPIVFQFLILLTEKRRFTLFDSILECYHELLNASQNFEEIVITTARPLKSDLQRKIETFLEKRIGEKIISETKVNPTLLGGIQIQIRNRLFDGSVSTKLKELKKQMFGLK